MLLPFGSGTAPPSFDLPYHGASEKPCLAADDRIRLRRARSGRARSTKSSLPRVSNGRFSSKNGAFPSRAAFYPRLVMDTA